MRKRVANRWAEKAPKGKSPMSAVGMKQGRLGLVRKQTVERVTKP